MSGESGCEIYSQNKISTKLEGILSSFHSNNESKINELAKKPLLEKGYIDWVVEGDIKCVVKGDIKCMSSQDGGVLIFRHAPSLANEIQQHLILGTFYKNFYQNPRLFLPPGAQEFIVIPQFAIKEINDTIGQDKGDIVVAVSKLKRTWMTAVLILSKCEVGLRKINLVAYNSLNEITMPFELDNLPSHDIRASIRKTELLAGHYGLTGGLIIRDATEVEEKQKKWQDKNERVAFVVSHGKKIRHEFLKLPEETDKRCGKIVGNLAVCYFDFAKKTSKLLSPGIPKHDITKALCDGNTSGDNCKRAHAAQRRTGDRGKDRTPTKTEEASYVENFFTCREKKET